MFAEFSFYGREQADRQRCTGPGLPAFTCKFSAS